MKHLSLSSILLFPLVIFFVMQYRIGPGTTPYALFGIIFLLLLAYIVVDLLHIHEVIYNRVKDILLWLVVVVVLGSAFSSTIIVRHQVAPIYDVHDIILQQEAALQFFIHGKNPYQETYFHTPMAAWHYSDTEVNPALYHFVMEPFYLVSAIPFYVLANHTLGYFDARIPLYLFFLAILVMAFMVGEKGDGKRQFVTLLAFNPAMLGYTYEGRSDMYMYVFLFLGLYLLMKKHISWAGVAFGLAFAVKQSMLPFVPLYIWYLFIQNKGLLWEKVKYTTIQLIPFVATILIILLPFYFWNPKAFIDSTILYLSGNSPHSYPISGYGWGMVLYQLGFIKNVHQYYPFTVWQIAVSVPTLIGLAWYMWKQKTSTSLITAYGIFLLIFWYFSRYFNNSHLGFISMVFLTAYFWPEKIAKEL